MILTSRGLLISEDLFLLTNSNKLIKKGNAKKLGQSAAPLLF